MVSLKDKAGNHDKDQLSRACTWRDAKQGHNRDFVDIITPVTHCEGEGGWRDSNGSHWEMEQIY